MKTLIIGKGEIGNALGKVLKDYNPSFIDLEPTNYAENPEIIHICFPYDDSFEKKVKEYREIYKPDHVIIHSTVKVGTCRELGAISSPVVGLHPRMEESLKTFTKFLAGEGASEVADYFRKAGMKIYVVDEAKSTELMKILDTTFYALCIEYTKEVKRQCKKFGVPFELWTLWTENYNKSYQKLGYPEFTRPNLTAIMKGQGGHCTISNLDFLDSVFTKFIKELNEN